MKWSKADLIILAVCFCSATVAGYLLYRSNLPGEGHLSLSNAIGSVTPQGDDVRLKSMDSSSWQKLKGWGAVQNYDRLFTGQTSKALVSFKTGEQIQVAPSSLIILQHEDGQRSQISLEAGSFFSDIRKNGVLIVKVGDKITEVKGDENSVLRIDRSETDKGLELTVVSGEIALKTEAHAVETIKGNQGVRLNQGGEVIERKSYKIEVQEPKASATVWKKDNESTVLRWTGSPENRQVKVLVAKDAEFKRVIKEVATERDFVETKSLPKEVLYWKVVAVDEEKNRIESPVSSFSLAPLAPPELLEPQSGQEFAFSESTESDVVFSWRDVSLSSAFKLEVASDENFRNILYKESVTSSAAQLAGLPAGTYFWRVTGFNVNRRQDLVSKPSHFTVSVQKAPVFVEPEPVIKDLASGPEIEDVSEPAMISNIVKRPNPPTLTRADLRFQLSDEGPAPILTWPSSEEVAEYRLQISLYEDFSKILIDRVTEESHFVWDEAYAGLFYARLSLISSEGVESDPVPFAKIQNILSPPRDLSINKISQAENGSAQVEVLWTDHKLATLHEIQIADDENFKTVKRKIVSEEPTSIFSDLQPGRYFFRVRYLNGSKWPVSIYSATTNLTLEVPPVIIPKLVLDPAAPDPTPLAVSEASPERKPALQDPSALQGRWDVGQDQERLARERAARKRHFRVWGGGGGTYQSLSQSQSRADGKTQSLSSGTYSMHADYYFNQNWAFEFSSSSRPGQMQASSSLLRGDSQYKTQTQAYEAKWAFTPPGALAQGQLRFGVQQHTLPILYGDGSALYLRQGQGNFASLGAEYTFYRNHGINYEILMRYQYPLSVSSTDGNWSFSSSQIFDGSLGLTKDLTENWFMGLYWHGQYFHMKNRYTPSSGSTSNSEADTTILNSNIEIKFGYQIFFGLPICFRRRKKKS